MTAPAPEQGTDAPTAEREAWDAYRESLRDLEGASTRRPSDRSWERLQGRCAS